MLTNQESLLIKEIGILLTGLGADTTKLRKLFKLSVDFDSLSLEERQKIQSEFNALP